MNYTSISNEWRINEDWQLNQINKAALYLLDKPDDLASEIASLDNDMSRGLDNYKFKTEGGYFTLTPMPEDELSTHLSAFARYIRINKDVDKDDVNRLIGLISGVRCAIGFSCHPDFVCVPEAWSMMFILAQTYKGFIFVDNNFILDTGTVVFGPLKKGIS